MKVICDVNLVGGHIDGALNINTSEDLHSQLMSEEAKLNGSDKVLVFHCDTSCERGPKMYSRYETCEK